MFAIASSLGIALRQFGPNWLALPLSHRYFAGAQATPGLTNPDTRVGVKVSYSS
ncbi:hypothetical protein AVDCRST_MAG81-5097 [uncultured Synechococcales cyanobacterium]|uniref:Uncharacterized protein n=1 Tax=uncultured Synechococcales cyanobacterium TaxID=1936017 RepID=A0A6J4VXE0_9CYAN|nr:hypothetical protein AVDCRST_MAG81-5097 [uncultured Synechococcales cyanobacterium]